MCMHGSIVTLHLTVSSMHITQTGAAAGEAAAGEAAAGKAAAGKAAAGEGAAGKADMTSSRIAMALT